MVDLIQGDDLMNGPYRIAPPVPRDSRIRDLILGIDFGSSTTIAGVLMGDRVELVADQADPVMPSLVYVPERGPVEVGQRVVHRQLTDPARVVRSIKRILGVEGDPEAVARYDQCVPYPVDHTGGRITLRFGTETFAPEQLVASILDRIRELAEVRFGAKISRAVISQSVNAPARYRDAMQRAARIAHLQVVEMIAEPVAGALALDLHTAPADRKIVICDFGGGTFDVSAVQQQALSFTPLAVAGDQFLGGDDLDDALAEAIAGTVYRQAGYDMHRDAVRWSELLMRCESAKRQLSTRADAQLAMREAYLERGQARDLHLTLDRSWVDAVWAPLIERAQHAIVDLLLRVRWRPDEVDIVGLIGGSSRVPAYRQMVAQLFGGEAKLLAMPAPELTVARGATLLTARHRAFATSRIPRLAASP